MLLASVLLSGSVYWHVELFAAMASVENRNVVIRAVQGSMCISIEVQDCCKETRTCILQNVGLWMRSHAGIKGKTST